MTVMSSLKPLPFKAACKQSLGAHVLMSSQMHAMYVLMNILSSRQQTSKFVLCACHTVQLSFNKCLPGPERKQAERDGAIRQVSIIL